MPVLSHWLPRLPRATEALVQALADRAVLQEGFRRLAGGVLQLDDVLAFELARLGCIGGGGDLFVGQAGEFLAGVDHDRRIIHFGQHVLAELRAQFGQLAIHRLELDLVGIGQLRAGAHEILVVLLDQARAFGIQAERARACRTAP